MSKHADYVPKHRDLHESPLTEAPRKALRKVLILSTAAVAVTGAAVTGGVAIAETGQSSSEVATALPAADAHNGSGHDTSHQDGEAASGGKQSATDAELAEDLAERSQTQVSRSQDRRDTVDRTKQRSLSTLSQRASAVTEREENTNADPKTVAQAMLSDFGWSSDEFGCLDSLWTRESGWNPQAANPSSSAYGIPQALPGSKMASEGADWATNPATQIKWGLGYIQDRYGSPCGAWAHSESNGWY